MADLTQRVSQVLQQLEQAKTERIRTEAALEAVDQNLKRLADEIREEYGCAPEELDAIISRLQNEIRTLVAEAEQLLEGSEVF